MDTAAGEKVSSYTRFWGVFAGVLLVLAGGAVAAFGVMEALRTQPFPAVYQPVQPYGPTPYGQTVQPAPPPYSPTPYVPPQTAYPVFPPSAVPPGATPAP